MNDRDREEEKRLGLSGGQFCRLDVTFADHPEYNDWVKFWCRNDEAQESMIETLKEVYHEQGFDPVFRVMSDEEGYKREMASALKSWPTWSQMVESDILKPLINPN